MAILTRRKSPHFSTLYMITVLLCERWSLLEGKDDLHLLGLFPFDSKIWAGGQSYLPAAQLAMVHINERDDVLPGYQLKMLWGDSKCNAGYAVDVMYRLLHSEPTKIMILGASCSAACQSIAQSAHLWNIVQMSYACVSPSLSDKSVYPLFTRNNPPDTVLNIPRLALLQEHGWTKVATITESARVWTEVTNDMIGMMKTNGMDVVSSESFSDIPTVQMENIKRKDVRIIVGNFYTTAALKVFCEAYKLQMYGAKYAWIIQGWYSHTWIEDSWKTDMVDCTQEQIATATEGALSVSSFTRHPEGDKKGVSNLTPHEYLAIYDDYVNNTGPSLQGYSSAGSAYDAVWALALALNNTMNVLEESNDNKRLEDFTYGDSQMAQLILKSMANVTFNGVMGRIGFNENGDAVADFRIQQIQDGAKVQIGIYKAELGMIQFDSNVPIVWQGDGPPIDDIKVDYVITKVPGYLYQIVSIVAVAGCICVVILLVINIKFRHVKIIKMSSPNINNIILCGCMFTYSSVLFTEFEGASFDPLVCCKASQYTLLLGVSSAYGALFSKTWRVHVIFTTGKLQKKIVKDGQLIAQVLMLVCIDVIIIALWEGIDPLKIVIRDTNQRQLEIGDKIFIYQIAFCESSYMSYWLGVIYSIKVLLLVFGVFLAWETRKVSIPALNDSRYIGMCIYNIVILSTLGAPIAYVLRYQPGVAYAITSVLVILGTTVTLCLLFLPKLMAQKDGQADQLTNNRTHPLATDNLTGNHANTSTGRTTTATTDAVPGNTGIQVEMRQP
ncbi:gamma-aminobutyric acid type B receptor subunit 2-like [Glandiceps talaboti]